MYKVFQKLTSKHLLPALYKKYSLPAFDNNYYIDEKPPRIPLDHGYICPLCKGSGMLRCQLCKDGCFYCSNSKFILCRCQFHG